jgi:cell wall-associated NlpC family hydrolase
MNSTKQRTNNLGFMLLFLGALLVVIYGLSNRTKRPAEATIAAEVAQPPIETQATESKSSLRDSLVEFSMKLLGTPYVYAGTSPEGFDCSGFVFYVFKHFGVTVPRSSSLYKNFGKKIPLSKVQKGDVLVFLSPTRNEIGHVGIVTVANGKETEFIHGSTGKSMKVILSSLKNEGYKKRFVKAVNVLGD